MKTHFVTLCQIKQILLRVPSAPMVWHSRTKFPEGGGGGGVKGPVPAPPPTYPPHLKVEFEAFSRMTSIPYVDLLIVKVKPLETSVYFKPTHTCSYIPWGSNTPRHVKLGWVTGECIRFLRLCSHEHYFNACWSRLQGALMCLGYPKHAWCKAPRQWSDKRRYVHDRGKVNEIEIVHVVRVPLHSSMPIPWAAMFSRIHYKLLPSIPSLQVRVNLQSSPNLRILFHTRRMRALKEEL